jgi:integrase
MAIKQAHTLDDQQLAKLLATITTDSRRPLVDRVVYLLSYTAGLRVQEIAGLRWEENLLDVDGKIKLQEFLVPGSKGRVKREMQPVLTIGSDIGKYGSARTLRIHPMLLKALENLRASQEPGPWVVPSGKPGASQDLRSRAHALKMRINRFYDAIGYGKCSSHSGRRSFVTKAARMANFQHCSLADVQKLAGHRHLTTTQAYIDITSSQSDLVGSLW